MNWKSFFLFLANSWRDYTATSETWHQDHHWLLAGIQWIDWEGWFQLNIKLIAMICNNFSSGFEHLTVNHSKHFKDPITGTHSNTIEGRYDTSIRWYMYLHITILRGQFVYFHLGGFVSNAHCHVVEHTSWSRKKYSKLHCIHLCCVYLWMYFHYQVSLWIHVEGANQEIWYWWRFIHRLFELGGKETGCDHASRGFA